MGKKAEQAAVAEPPATSFTFRSATIVARSLTIGDENDIEELLLKLPENTRYLDAYRFGQFVIAAQVEGEPPVAMVKESDSAEAILEAFQHWQKLPGGLWRKFDAALAAAEQEELG